MRFIAVEPGLEVRFPAQSLDFMLGVEIGVLTSMLGMGLHEFTREIATDNLSQARALAASFGYTLVPGEPRDDVVEITVFRGARKPKLRVVR